MTQDLEPTKSNIFEKMSSHGIPMNSSLRPFSDQSFNKLKKSCKSSQRTSQPPNASSQPVLLSPTSQTLSGTTSYEAGQSTSMPSFQPSMPLLHHMRSPNLLDHMRSSSPAPHQPQKRSRTSETGSWLRDRLSELLYSPSPIVSTSSVSMATSSPGTSVPSTILKPNESSLLMRLSEPSSDLAMTSSLLTTPALNTSKSLVSHCMDHMHLTKTQSHRMRRGRVRHMRRAMKSAENITQLEDVDIVEDVASTNISVIGATREDTPSPTATPPESLVGARPRFHHSLFDFSSDTPLSPVLRYTYTAHPLPSPPDAVSSDPLTQSTIHNNPDLFKIVTPINVDTFQTYLASHPNRQFVDSICDGLRHGFWPGASAPGPDYPVIVDESNHCPPQSSSNELFILQQRDTEIALASSSHVTNHSAGPHALNSLIPQSVICGPLLDTLKDLGNTLLRFREEHRDIPLVLFKSDVKGAYHLMPVCFEWQLKQINTTNGLHHVDHCTCFGNSGSAITWIDFIALVIWIAVFIKLIDDLFDYSDDAFSFEIEGHMLWYEPYSKFFPAKQTRLLSLWDELGIPHEEKKQIFGSVITIIGFEVDVNKMTFTMSSSSKADLLQAIDTFLHGIKFSLHQYQSLTGHINWAFNVFPLLCPGLCNIYFKIGGETNPNSFHYMNNAMKADLCWLAHHVSNSSGVYVLNSHAWDIKKPDIAVFCDACLSGMGFWFPNLKLGFYYPITFPLAEEKIYLLEGICVASAIYSLKDHLPLSTTIIYSDSMNMVNIFNTLKAVPSFNPILTCSVNEIIKYSYDIRVLHVCGVDNTVADALSHGHFNVALALVPGLKISDFTPPQDALGSLKNDFPVCWVPAAPSRAVDPGASAPLVIHCSWSRH
ncbi:hypothetical protein CPB84DRAFT_1846686 [Gymnopilus junonius]|uniref:Reverse transcriptase domain-containing protein n=1 Tax=Gymnopilus junonius TaxID=109634 RepID=A0A9P5NP79_GYMJU|nr:hypothetical protein CPB84DRAFT_1846686 [Gymnopilus junonius]